MELKNNIMLYTHDIFYKLEKLTKKQIRELFIETKELSYNWWVDDEPTRSRRKIDMPFETVLNIFDKTPRKHLHITFIHRMSCCRDEKEHLEIGFCTLIRKDENGKLHTDGDIFLWMEVDMKHKTYLLEKYNLQKRLL